MRVLRALAVVLVTLALMAIVAPAALRPPRIPVPERGRHVLAGVTLVEPGRPPRPCSKVAVEDGVITAIEECNGEVCPLGEWVGLYLTPGLVDMHVHYPPSLAVGNAELWNLLFLAHGVTAVRETGSIDGAGFATREDILAGRTPGPRIVSCGAMLDGPNPSFPSNRVVEGVGDARRAVREQVARGAGCIKVYNMLGREELEAIVHEAAELGVPVIGHKPHSVPFEEAGVTDLQHGTGVVEVSRATIEARTDFETADWAGVDAERIAYAAEISRAQGIAHTPTLVNARMRRLLVEEDPSAAIAADTGLRHLPEFWLGAWTGIWSPPWTAGDAPAHGEHAHFRERQAAMTAALHAAGVRIHAGTDTLMPYVAPGSSLLGEIEDLVAAGIPREAAWKIATEDNAAGLGVEGLGRLRPGAPADLLVLRVDPTQEPVTPDAIAAVVADGRLYRRADLDAALARMDAHFHGEPYRTVMAGGTALLRGGFAPDRGE